MLNLAMVKKFNLDKDGPSGWSLEVDDHHIRLVNPLFGELKIGGRPEGFAGWSFHEHGGGGVVIIPYAMIQNVLFVGLLKEHRALRGGIVLNAPRGFLNDTSALKTANREQEEEIGFLNAMVRMHQLPGNPANPNSAFFETEINEGVRFFAFMLQENELEETHKDSVEGTEGRVFQVKRNLVAPLAVEENSSILGLLFYRWTVAAKIGDMFSNAAVARLLASLEAAGCR